MPINRPLTDEEFKQIYSKVPKLCVDIIIQTEQGILLTKRSEESWKGMWHIPGGTVHYKEYLREAVRRIAREEIQVEVVVKKFLGYIEFASEEKARGFGWSVSLAFLCSIASGVPSVNEQASDLSFFTVIPDNTISEQKEFLENFLA